MKLIAAIAMLSMALSLCGLSERFAKKDNNSNYNSNASNSNASNSNSSNSNKSSSSNKNSSTSDGNAEQPEMTSEQKTAIESGQTVAWEGKGLSWTVPAKWTRESNDETTFQYKSPGTWDAGRLIVTISGMGTDFPVDISTKAMHDSDETSKRNGQILSYRYLALDGIKGVEDLETEKPSKEDPRRLEWRGYRKYKGQVQLITIILASQSQHFPKHDDELHAILYSTKIEKD